MTRPLTLDPVLSSSNAGPRPAQPMKPRWGNGSRDPVCASVALRLGLTPQYAEKLLRLAPRLLAAVIRELLATGNVKRVAALMEGVDRAREGREPPPDCPATWSLADAADGKEDLRQHEYERTPNVRTRAAYIEALREDRRFTTALIDMLIDEQERAQHTERQS